MRGSTATLSLVLALLRVARGCEMVSEENVGKYCTDKNYDAAICSGPVVDTGCDPHCSKSYYVCDGPGRFTGPFPVEPNNRCENGLILWADYTCPEFENEPLAEHCKDVGPDSVHTIVCIHKCSYTYFQCTGDGGVAPEMGEMEEGLVCDYVSGNENVTAPFGVPEWEDKCEPESSHGGHGGGNGDGGHGGGNGDGGHGGGNGDGGHGGGNGDGGHGGNGDGGGGGHGGSSGENGDGGHGGSGSEPPRPNR